MIEENFNSNFRHLSCNSEIDERVRVDKDLSSEVEMIIGVCNEIGQRVRGEENRGKFLDFSHVVEEAGLWEQAEEFLRT